jgi:predicted nucleotidyltransferase
LSNFNLLRARLKDELIKLKMGVRAREGDFIETFEGLIFDVKGLLHPPDRVIAYLRYVPDGRGGRKRAGTKYRKVYSLCARAKLLARKWPQYVYRDPFFNREVQAVPHEKVKQYYFPAEKFAQLRRATELDQRERLAADMAETLVKEAAVSASDIGVSGSILVSLHTSKSDIDLLLYGSDAARRCHSKLRAMVGAHSHGFAPYEKSDLRKLYTQRGLGTAISFETFAKQERMKVLQGRFRGADYFIRCIKKWDEWHEAYGDRKYYPVCRATIRATISDNSDSIFTPCTYHIVNVGTTGKHPEPNQIVSFRGRFCEQARRGEHILAKGNLERAIDERGETYRLVIGEDPHDCLVVVGKHE